MKIRTELEVEDKVDIQHLVKALELYLNIYERSLEDIGRYASLDHLKNQIADIAYAKDNKND